MSDVFSQISIQIVFAVKHRQALIQPHWEASLYKFITGLVQSKGHKMLAIGGMPDHVHIFIGLKPAEALSELVREIKWASTRYVAEQQFSSFKFEWQNGYGAFSYSRSHRNQVCQYILNQKEHHKKFNFQNEYLTMLNNFEIDVGKKRLFEFLE
jgi:putative transposase